MRYSKDCGTPYWALLPLLLAVAGCGSSEAIILQPKTAHVARERCPAVRRGFELAAVQDRRGYANPRNVGFTQTGLLNVQASLETPRPAAEVLHGALATTLADCGLQVPKGRGPDTLLKVELITMQLSEKTGFTSEMLKGQVRYEVEALDSSTRTLLKRFVVDGQSEATGIDTTSDAEAVINQALGAGLADFLKALSSLPVRTVPTLANGSAPLPSTASPIVPSRITATARRLGPDEEGDRFGTTLKDKNVLSIELSLQRDGAGTHPIKLRRHRIRMTFDDGSERFPLDPLKVQERHRMNVTVPVYAGGLLFVPLAMETAGNTTGLTSAVDELVMPTARNELKGLLFFDLEGASSSKPKRLELEYEDTETATVQRALLDFR